MSDKERAEFEAEVARLKDELAQEVQSEPVAWEVSHHFEQVNKNG